MYKNHCDVINENDNVIIGLGDSFTQGVGAYSLETWASMSNPAFYNISGQYFLDEQAKNNYIRQLVTYYLPNYKVYNLGVNGGGNRATVRELYLNPLPKKLGNVIVILLATGIERFDFLKKSDETAGKDWHQKWQTIFPTVTDRAGLAEFQTHYFKQIWSKRNDAFEFLFTICELENFCKAHGYKFVFASAFDTSINQSVLIKLLDNKKEYINMIEWNNFISIPGHTSVMDLVNRLENPYRDIYDIHKHQSKLKMPSKYITPCTHWTIEGNRFVAEFMYKELKERNLI